MKKRFLYYKLEDHIKDKSALIVTGMRQVGKTTIMRQLFDKLEDKPKLWFDFDNPLDQKIFEAIDYNTIIARLENMAGIKKGVRLYVFIDEVQNYPEMTKVIKYLIDHHKTKFFVTGSSSFYLKNLFPESLSGRKFLFELGTLSFREYLYFKDAITLEQGQDHDIDVAIKWTGSKIVAALYQSHYEEYLKWGGFPEVVITNGAENKTMILRNIFASFFEKDLKIISDFKDIRELRDLLLLLVPRVGSLLDLSRIASELGTDRAKIYNYLEFLQGVFVIKLLPKFSKSIDRTVAGGKKIVFSDNGLLRIIGEVNEGQLFENSVANQLSGYGDLSFYNLRNKEEIDFILDKKYGFEAKLTGCDSDVTRISHMVKKIGIKKGFVVSKNPVPVKDNGIICPFF